MDDLRIAVVGLGYVGLPLALAFAKVACVTGYDVDAARIATLADGRDRAGDVTADALASTRITFTGDAAVLRNCNVFIITVPTPTFQRSRLQAGRSGVL